MEEYKSAATLRQSNYLPAMEDSRSGFKPNLHSGGTLRSSNLIAQLAQIEDNRTNSNKSPIVPTGVIPPPPVGIIPPPPIGIPPPPLNIPPPLLHPPVPVPTLKPPPPNFSNNKASSNNANAVNSSFAEQLILQS